VLEDDKPILQGMGFRVGFIVLVILLAVVLFFALPLRPLPRFDDITNADVRLGHNFDRVLRVMGYPLETEYYIDYNHNKFLVLYYEGITFFIARPEDTTADSYNTIAAIDITDEQFRLGGRGENRIGVGSFRNEVLEEFETRVTNSRWWNFGVPFVYIEIEDMFGLYGAGFGYVNTVHGTFVEFVFGEDDDVMKMRIGLVRISV